MTLEEKKKIHAQFVFIYRRLTETGQYFVDEFEIAKDTIATVVEMCKKMQEEIKELESNENKVE